MEVSKILWGAVTAKIVETFFDKMVPSIYKIVPCIYKMVPSASLFSKLKDCFDKKDIDFSHAVGQSYDGAYVMTGK